MAGAPCWGSSCFLQHLIAGWRARRQTHQPALGDIFSPPPSVTRTHHTMPMMGITIVTDNPSALVRRWHLYSLGWAAQTQVSLCTELSPKQIMHLSRRHSRRFACLPQGNDRGILLGWPLSKCTFGIAALHIVLCQSQFLLLLSCHCIDSQRPRCLRGEVWHKHTSLRLLMCKWIQLKFFESLNPLRVFYKWAYMDKRHSNGFAVCSMKRTFFFF